MQSELTQDIFIAGTGSYAAEIGDWAQAAGHHVRGLVELRDDTRVGADMHGFPVVSARAVPPAGRIVLAIGRERRASWELLAGAGWTAITLVHPSASLAADVHLDPGATIGPLAVVGAGSMIGAHAVVSRGALVGHHVEVGAFAVINPGANIGGNTTIGEDAVVGIGATVVNARAIGARAVLAAGAVVVRDVEPDTRVQGVPARPAAGDVP
jgi:sugar O-acyltransferase (sialic acid O-acetyltransferase NeuD family)